MKTEKIVYTPEVILPQRRKSDDTVTLTVPKQTAKTAAMLAATMLSLASMAKADIKTAITIDPKDLTYESSDECDKDWFKKFVEGREDIKSYARVDKNTLRYVDMFDEVAETIVKDGVHDAKILGYTLNGNLYPQKGKGLNEQQYMDEETYQTQKEQMIRYQKEMKLGASLAVALLAVIMMMGAGLPKKD